MNNEKLDNSVNLPYQLRPAKNLPSGNIRAAKAQISLHIRASAQSDRGHPCCLYGFDCYIVHAWDGLSLCTIPLYAAHINVKNKNKNKIIIIIIIKIIY